MSTMEAEALNQVDQETAARKFAIEDQLFQQALGYSTQASNVTKQLLDTSIAEDKDYRDALANFTKALAYAGGGGRTSPTYTLTPTA